MDRFANYANRVIINCISGGLIQNMLTRDFLTYLQQEVYNTLGDFWLDYW